jgi:hypothetical protein
MESRKGTTQPYVIAYKQFGDTQWMVCQGWIRSEDAEDFRQYFVTLPGCEDFYIVPSPPLNNALLMLNKVRSDCEGSQSSALASVRQLGERKAVVQRFLKRHRRQTRSEDSEEAERKAEFERITDEL